MAQTLYSYIVRGKGNFPIDMLCHDRAWPATPASVVRIEQTFSEKAIPQEIHIYSHSVPTVSRWRSYGWTVEEK